MNDRHKRFADEYITNGFNGYLAYIAVYGVKKNRHTAESNATRLLSNAEIKQYVEDRKKELSQNTQVDFDWIVEQQINVYNLALIQQKQSITGEMYAKPDLGNANKAIDQLAKLHGAYAPDKTQISGDLGISIDIDLND
jgi:phage terminase small subunit